MNENFKLNKSIKTKLKDQLDNKHTNQQQNIDHQQNIDQQQQHIQSNEQINKKTEELNYQNTNNQQSNQMDSINLNSQLNQKKSTISQNESSQIQDQTKLNNKRILIPELNKDKINRYYDNNINNLDENSSSSDMSISSVSSISKKFPEFFDNQTKKFKPNPLIQLTEQEKSIKIPGILENQSQQQNDLNNNVDENKNYDDDSIDDLNNSIESELIESNEKEKEINFQNSNDLITNLLKHDNQLNLLDDFLNDLNTNEKEHLKIMNEQSNKSFDLNKEALDRVFNKISIDNQLSRAIVENIIKKFLSGSSSAYIARYEQHFDYKINSDYVCKVLKQFNYLRNVMNLKYLKKLSLDKKDRFDQFGNQLLDKCMSYEEIAKIYFLYYECAEKDIYLDDELSLKLLHNEAKLDITLYDKINKKIEKKPKILYQIVIKMVSHYLAKNDQILEYLNSLTEKPTISIKLILSNHPYTLEKYRKYEILDDELIINKTSPVDILQLINGEESNLVKIQFNSSNVEKKLFEFISINYPLANIEFLKDVFNYLWNYYFKKQLECYYRYEMKTISKKLLKDDLVLRLTPILNRKPPINETILTIEPIGALGEEGFQYGIQLNNLKMKNDYFKIDKNNSFNDFFLQLHKSYRFTFVALPSSYYSIKIRELIKECLNRSLSNYKISVLTLPNDNYLLETLNKSDRINYYLDRITDPLRQWISFNEYMTIPDCEYFELLRPHLSEILNELFYQSVSLLPVDLNLEGVSILKYVNGLNEKVAEQIVEHRKQNGQFINRRQLKRVKFMTDEIYNQCCGFLTINKNTILKFEENKLLYDYYDSTMIHPDFYDDADKVLEHLNILKENLGKDETREKCRSYLMQNSMATLSERLNINEIRIKIIIEALLRPLNVDYRTNIN